MRSRLWTAGPRYLPYKAGRRRTPIPIPTQFAATLLSSVQTMKIPPSEVPLHLPYL